jgi:hypothetical protein
MDVPDKYEHLGWRLSTARRTDPPHRLLTVHDIDSAFRDARAAQTSGRQCKKIAIVIINTVRVQMHASNLQDMTLPYRNPHQKKNQQNKGQTYLLQASRGFYRPGYS